MKKGVYGLIVPSKKKKKAAPMLDLDDSSDEEEVNVAEQVERERKKKLRKAEEEAKKLMEENPNLYSYDEVYDEMNPDEEEKGKRKGGNTVQRKSQYIGALMQKAKAREREQELLYERRIAKERAADDHLYEDKDKFVTGAYKRKLEERKKWEEEEKLREEREKADDVTKKKDLSGFYSNLLDKNVAYGGFDREKAEREALEKEKKDREEEEKRKREEAEAQRQKARRSPTSLRAQQAYARAAMEEVEAKRRKQTAEEEEQLKKKMARRNDDSSISAAKQRYLERKAQREKKGEKK